MDKPSLSTLPVGLQDLVVRYLQTRPRCLLCHGPCDEVRVFLPSDPEAWGFQEGARGGAIFALCRPCSESEDLQTRVTEKLWQDKRQSEAVS